MLKKIEEIFLYNKSNDEIEVIHNKIVEELMILEKEKYDQKMNELKNMKYLSVMNVIDKQEKEQLENWSGKKCYTILFDSNKHNWNINSSVFYERINGKSNLVFIVENTNNKCGYYLNGEIDQIDKYSKAKGSFLFTLKSKGSKKGMKFEEKDNAKGLYVYNTNHERLFGIFYGFTIHKKDSKDKSYIYQNSEYFDYHGNVKSFNKKLNYQKQYDYTEFKPKRIIVIEMK